MPDTIQIGDVITWAKQTPEYTIDGKMFPYHPYQEGPGTVLELFDGTDIKVDIGGSTDWLERSRMAWIKVEPTV